MIIPNKFISFEESALAKVSTTYNLIDGKATASEIYEKNKSKYDSIDQYIYSIEILYITEKVTLNEINGTLYKC